MAASVGPLFVITVIAGLTVGSTALTTLQPVALVGVTTLALAVIAQYRVTEDSLRAALLAGLALFAVSFVVLYIGTMTRYGTLIFSGSNSHTLWAVDMVGEPFSELVPPPSNDYYYVFLTVLYGAGRFGYVVPILVNLVAFWYLVVVTYRLGDLCLGETHARNAVAILVVFPTCYLHLYRTGPDILSVALVMGVVYALTRLRSLSQWRLFVRIVVLTGTLLLLRPQLAVLLLLVAVATVTLRLVWDETTRRHIVRTAGLSVIMAAIFSGVLYVSNIWGIRSQSVRGALNQLLSSRVPTQGAGLSTLIYDAPLPIRLLSGFVPLAITPFPPWESFTASPAMTFFTVGGLIFFALAPFALAGLVETVRQTTENALALTMYTLGITAVLALVYGGFALKFRLLLVPPFAMFASVGLEARKRYRYFVALCYIGYPVVVTVYLFLTGAV